MLEFTILGLLKERPMYGYELRKRMREEFGALENLSFGSLYPALARLESDGAIQTLEPDPVATPTPVPFSGSLGGERAATLSRRTLAAAVSGRGTRSRKIYEITPSGEALFERLLDTTEERDDPRSFSLRLAFARHLSPAARLRLFERHALELNRRLIRASAALEAPPRPLDEYQRAIAEHAREAIRSDLSWVNALVEREIDTRADASRRQQPSPTPDPRLPAAAGAGGTHDGGNP